MSSNDKCLKPLKQVTYEYLLIEQSFHRLIPMSPVFQVLRITAYIFCNSTLVSAIHILTLFSIVQGIEQRNPHAQSQFHKLVSDGIGEFTIGFVCWAVAKEFFALIKSRPWERTIPVVPWQREIAREILLADTTIAFFAIGAHWLSIWQRTVSHE